MPLAFYLDFATKQEGLRRFIDSKGLLSPRIVSLSCRPLPPSDNKGKDLAVIKQFFTDIFYQSAKLESPGLLRPLVYLEFHTSSVRYTTLMLFVGNLG